LFDFSVFDGAGESGGDYRFISYNAGVSLPTLPGGQASDSVPGRPKPSASQTSSLDAQIDRLSPAGRAVLRLGGPAAYGQLVPQNSGSAEARTALTSLLNVLDAPPGDRDEADCLLAALWLWHDFLDEAHAIVQKIETRSGSYWHAVMHRREGDFSNSKYWYARAEGHPIYMTLATRADDLLRQVPADKQVFRITARGWNPSALVDLVEAVYQKPNDPRHGLAVALQRLEWQTMFDAGVRASAG